MVFLFRGVCVLDPVFSNMVVFNDTVLSQDTLLHLPHSLESVWETKTMTPIVALFYCAPEGVQFCSDNCVSRKYVEQDYGILSPTSGQGAR